MASKPKVEEPKIDFSDIGAKLKKSGREYKLFTDLDKAINFAYLNNLKKDKDGKDWKENLSEDEAKKLGNDIADELVYHAHRRQFNIKDGTYKDIGNLKDEMGNSYKDAVVEHWFGGFNRDQFISGLKERAKLKQKFNANFMRDALDDNIQKHQDLVRQKPLSVLQDPTLSGDIQKEIERMKTAYNIEPDIAAYNKDNFNSVFQTYRRLATQYGGPAKKKGK